MPASWRSQDPVKADEVLRIGLVSMVVEPEELLAKAQGIAARIAAKSTSCGAPNQTTVAWQRD